MAELEIRNLHVSVEDKEILRGLDLDVEKGKVLCSHESDGDHACATKLLWTRVQGGVTKALAGTTLAELVEFSGGADRAEKTPVSSAA